MGAIDDLDKILRDIKGSKLGRGSGLAFGREGHPLTRELAFEDKKRQKRAADKTIYKSKYAPRPPEERPGGTGETIFFGLLSSILLIIAGGVSGLEYVSLVGALGAALFVIALFLKVSRQMFYWRKGKEIPAAPAEKIQELESRINELDVKTGFGVRYDEERIRKMDEKIEELRYIVKSLTRAIEEKEDQGTNAEQ